MEPRRPNKRMNLTKRGLSLGGWPALASRRRAIFIQSRFAGYPRCSTVRHCFEHPTGTTATTPALTGYGVAQVKPTREHHQAPWPRPATTSGYELLATELGSAAGAAVSRAVRRRARLRTMALMARNERRLTAVGLPSNKGMNLTKRGLFLLVVAP